jgi:uncharacterized cofD-like protein
MKLWRRLPSALRWLIPGIGVKRWLLLLAAGVAALSLALASLIRGLYPLPDLFYYLTLQFIPRFWRAALLGLGGIAAVVISLAGLKQALLAPFLSGVGEGVADAVYRFRRRGRGPRVVAIGGGHGLAVLLRGMKQHTSNLTAIVTMADDGGSSGRLRRDLGVLPPGDVRNCIAALADDEALITRLFQYRFGDRGSLDGHSLGNLFITAMAEVAGSFERATVEAGRVLAVQGEVLPSTLQDVTLMADLKAEGNGVSRVKGESQIPDAAGEIERVFLTPDDAAAYPGAVRALLEADLIVAGPGSLYTSILPNLLVPDVTRAIAASRAVKVYVCNVATQRGETEGYTAGDHVAALERHSPVGLFSIVLANDRLDVTFDAPDGVTLVQDEFPASAPYRIVRASLVDAGNPWRHDSDKLAGALLDLL